MKKIKFLTIISLFVGMFLFSSCERVKPNYIGVLMENFGKNGKSDYSKQKGRVVVFGPSRELFQSPLYEQRAEFENRVLHLKASDNTEFTCKPLYAYKIIEDRAVDVVFNNSQLGSGDEFMKALENKILEPAIYDLMKEASRKYSTETLMAEGGSLKFEQDIQTIIKNEFNNKGFELVAFSCQLEFTDKVKAKIDSRNEVNTNISVIDQQIAEQKKRNELAILKAQENINLSKGLTNEILIQSFIDKWDGKTAIYGNTPISTMLNR